jgi:uncharacterized OB-fold protein
VSIEQALPVPDVEWPPLKPYWEAARRHELRLPQCAACKHFNWYPEDKCADCGSEEFAWVKLSGRGILFSWAVVHRALDSRLGPLQPYTVAIMQIAEDPATRLVLRLLDVDPAMLQVGMPVKIRFEDFGYPVAKTGIIGPFCVVA